MDNFEIDELFGSTSGKATPNDDFKRQILKKSTVALRKGYKLQRRLKISGLILGIFLITFGAFIFGQFSAYRSPESFRMSAKNHTSTYIGKSEQVARVTKEESFWQTKVLASLHQKFYQDYESNIQTIGLLKNYRQFIKGKYHE